MKKVIYVLLISGFMVTSCGKVIKSSAKLYKSFKKGVRTEKAIAKKNNSADELVNNGESHYYNINIEDDFESDKSTW